MKNTYVIVGGIAVALIVLGIAVPAYQHSDREAKLTACLAAADAKYQEKWATACQAIADAGRQGCETYSTFSVCDAQYRDYPKDCALDAVSSDFLNTHKQTDKDNCFKQFPQD